MWQRILLAVQMALFTHSAYANRDPSPYGINSWAFILSGLAAVIALWWWKIKMIDRQHSGSLKPNIRNRL